MRSHWRWSGAHVGGGTDAPARSEERASRAHAASSFGGPHRYASVGTGFRSRAKMDRHFAKHGAEFGGVTEAEYLREAQALRGAPAGETVEESTRPDESATFFEFGRNYGEKTKTTVIM